MKIKKYITKPILLLSIINFFAHSIFSNFNFIYILNILNFSLIFLLLFYEIKLHYISLFLFGFFLDILNSDIIGLSSLQFIVALLFLKKFKFFAVNEYQKINIAFSYVIVLSLTLCIKILVYTIYARNLSFEEIIRNVIYSGIFLILYYIFRLYFSNYQQNKIIFGSIQNKTKKI